MSMVDVKWVVTGAPRDMPFDGCPDECEFINRKGLKIQCYKWSPMTFLRQCRSSGLCPERRMKYCTTTRGVIVILHGVKAHLRLSWLAKRPNESMPIPLSEINVVEPASATEFPNTDSCPTLCSSCSMASYSSSSLGSVPQGANNPPSYNTSDQTQRDTCVFYEGSWIEAFNAAGFVVIGMDLQGHGRSEGLNNRRCYVDSFSDYTSDLQELLETVVRAEYQKAPLFLFGVSISTLVVLDLLSLDSSRHLNVTGTCLLSGLFKVGTVYNQFPLRALLGLVRIARKIMPTAHLPSNAWSKHTHKNHVNAEAAGDLGPQWQQIYGAHDPYLIREPFTMKILGEALVAVRHFEWGGWRKVVENDSCSSMLLLHNYNDNINPIESGIVIYSQIMAAGNTQDNQKYNAVVFNSPTDHEDKKANAEHQLWDANVIADSRALDLEHTLVTDKENGPVFQKVYHWIKSMTDLGPTKSNTTSSAFSGSAINSA